MAIMIPDEPREYTANSLEDEMFEALKSLGDDYYVVHSFKNVYVHDNTLYEGETDFLVFNPNYGIICIEAKAGHVGYKSGKWMYGGGKEMKHGGPYNQASGNKWDLINRIKYSSLHDILRRCKFLHAVWFPSVKKAELYSNRFPAEFERNITMTMEDLENPEEALLRIFDIKLEYDIQTDLSDSDVKRLLREIICPEFNIFPSRNFDVDLKKITFHRLLKEQFGLLNYLEDQRTAVINGAAGTGKTMIAIEKAMRHAACGENVLFLCYNAYLKEHLETTFPHENIDFMTISKFACKICNTKEADFKLASDKIVDMYLTNTFPYNHVIVDEGQDFGNDNIEEADILQCIHDIVADNQEEQGTFYVFYDKLQLVQATSVPQYINEADCKLTLYRNCRNTENIATTSLKAITERVPKLFSGAIKGIPAKIHYRSNSELQRSRVDEVIELLKQDGVEDVVILTCETEEKSFLRDFVQNGKYKKKIFTTCRKFKGLEADAIILIDVSKQTFSGESAMRFYVGASRARLRLDIITAMSDDECEHVLREVLKYNKKIKKPKKDLAIALNAFPNVE